MATRQSHGDSRQQSFLPLYQPEAAFRLRPHQSLEVDPFHSSSPGIAGTQEGFGMEVFGLLYPDPGIGKG